jgi:methylenetetrahydrofolate--tRNA-(uracil-5-)-methyltransferase
VNATVIGGGLAGCEAAWQLARRGVAVTLYEMRPSTLTPAHQTDRLAELVCSNTFKSLEVTNAHGLLKAELLLLDSLLMEAADAARIPGGAALTVDRDEFSRTVTERITAHPAIAVRREEVVDLPSPAIVATGPLTSDALARTIAGRLGQESLAFYDAIAPIVSAESLDLDRLYRLSRYGKGEGDDFLNAPLSADEYYAFIDALIAADQYPGHDFDPIPSAGPPVRRSAGSPSAVPYFEGCLPVEEMARRGRDTLRFGPLKPVGLADPRTGREPYAVVQLRREDRAGQMWNLVGFQTRLRVAEQRRIFATLPGLARAEFLRLGSVHRNTYLNAPAALTAHHTAKDDPHLFFAGQLTGVEGYTESLATGLLAGVNLARILSGLDPVVPPPETMLGALMRYVTTADPARFQPMNANLGLLPPLAGAPRDKGKKREQLAERALEAMRRWIEGERLNPGSPDATTNPPSTFSTNAAVDSAHPFSLP